MTAPLLAKRILRSLATFLVEVFSAPEPRRGGGYPSPPHRPGNEIPKVPKGPAEGWRDTRLSPPAPGNVTPTGRRTTT